MANKPHLSTSTRIRRAYGMIARPEPEIVTIDRADTITDARLVA